MTARVPKLFEVYFDDAADPWFLSDPDPWIEWQRGAAVESVERVRFEVTEDAQRVDVTISGAVIVVKEWVGDLIDGLAPGDVRASRHRSTARTSPTSCFTS